MSKKPSDEKLKSSKKISEKNPNRVNSDYCVAKKKACEDLKREINEKPKAAVGRPSTYTDELAQYILDKVATSHKGLKQLCSEDDKMPNQDTINMWRWKHKEFSDLYLAAKQMQAHLLAEDCEEVAKEERYYKDGNGELRLDPAFVASRRLIVDTKRWYASKLAPRFFGDRKSVDELITDQDTMKAELIAIKTKLDEKNEREY